MKAPEEIVNLVERFKDNLEAYKSGRYNETQVRLEFINPFFKALGWDVQNEKGWAEAYKDVIHEDAIKVGGMTKAPDYCFRIGGARKFFLEAKKPSVDIKRDIHPAYQLRRYAWSAKLPLSILTDFEEFAVYDCRFKPIKTDKASTARIMYINFREYAGKWEEINSVFSREAILKGSFDRYIESGKKKRGTAEVDSAFLKEIESWRETLAKNIALRNSKLSQRAINFSVQKIIDRIIFLRISEDRGLESEGALREIGNKNQVYKQLCGLFVKADERYNSGLFHFKKEKALSTHPDELTLKIKLDDAPLKIILKNLYYPDSPYEFSVLPPDILGHVYEQFLGKVIRLTSSHRAVIEEKPEVRKAGGVYYTPTYIVDYIVKNTVGKLLEGKTPKKAEKLKILDPACGSGSFLIGAYQYLLDWHRDLYIKHGPKKHRKVLYQAAGGDWRLTTDEKKRILLNNIYGVDIDEQAVEVTKLALLLKVLEGETQLQLLHERVLPNLGNNIKCGNSLIGPDFYENQPMDLFDEKERYRINVFDWKAEFPEILTGKNPGFDAVIGNPPYFNISILDKKIFHYLESKYKKIHTGYNDIMYYFIYKGIELLNNYGVYGVITSNYYLGNSYAKLLRKYLKEHISKIINFKDFLIFEDANIHTNIIIAHKNPKSNEIHFFEKIDKQTLNLTYLETNLNYFTLSRKKLLEDWVIAGDKSLNLIEKIENKKTSLGDLAIIEQGSKSGKNKIFTVSYKFAQENKFEKDILRKNVKNSDIERYLLKERQNYLIYVDNNTAIRKYPNIYNYLSKHRKGLSERNEVKQGLYSWFRFDRPRRKEVFDSPEKLVVPYRAEYNRFAYDNEKYFNDGGDIRAIVLKEGLDISIKYVLGILNSTLMNWYYGFVGKPKGKSREYFNKPMSKIPIRAIDFSNPTGKNRHDRIVKLADQMLKLNKQLAKAKTSHDKTAIQRQIDATDHQIDGLVYELYNLTSAEIKIIEK